jgi:hypothetical protein
MDRERPVSDEGTREENESEIFGDEEALTEGPAADELEEVSEDSAGEELRESADTESEEPRRRRRRRGRRRSGDRGPRGERPSGHRPHGEALGADAGMDDDADEDMDEDSGDLTGESELGAEDDSEEGDDAPRVYRNVPTWEEAISFLVHKRPEGRSRDDSGPREGRRDGGRPR